MPKPHVKVNRVADVIERTFWTFLNSFLGLVVVGGVANVNLSTVHALAAAATAAALTTAKTLVAQHVGENNDGAAIPGGILETDPAPPQQP